MKVLKDIVAHWGFVDSEQLKVLAKEFPRMKLVIKWGGMPREEALACHVADRIKQVEDLDQDYVREVFVSSLHYNQLKEALGLSDE
jgi:ABC-type taurine transport system substrate-binding protein